MLYCAFLPLLVIQVWGRLNYSIRPWIQKKLIGTLYQGGILSPVVTRGIFASLPFIQDHVFDFIVQKPPFVVWFVLEILFCFKEKIKSENRLICISNKTISTTCLILNVGVASCKNRTEWAVFGHNIPMICSILLSITMRL